MPIDRDSYAYRIEWALFTGRPPPEPRSETERRTRDRRLLHQAREREQQAAEHAAAMAREPVRLDVRWTGATLLHLEGECTSDTAVGRVHLRRSSKLGARVVFLGDHRGMKGRPLELNGEAMANPLRIGCVPGREWGLDGFLVQQLSADVPEAVADAAFDPFGQPPKRLIYEWDRMRPEAAEAAAEAWRCEWRRRHSVPHPRRDLNQAPASDIAASVRGVADWRARAIVEERDLRGAYESLWQIAARVRGVGPRTVEGIIRAGYRV